MAPPKVACEERERLETAYRDALRSRDELETQLSARIVSSNPNTQRRTKNELRRASKRPSHLLDELMVHRKKHGCE